MWEVGGVGWYGAWRGRGAYLRGGTVGPGLGLSWVSPSLGRGLGSTVKVRNS